MKVSVELENAAAKGYLKQGDRIALGDDPVTAHVQADYLVFSHIGGELQFHAKRAELDRYNAD